MQNMTILYKNKVYKTARKVALIGTDPCLDFAIHLDDIIKMGGSIEEYLKYQCYEIVDTHEQDFNQKFVYEVDDDMKVWFCDFDFECHWMKIERIDLKKAL